MGDYGGVGGVTLARLGTTGGTLAFTGTVFDVRLLLLAGAVLTVVGAVLLRFTWRRHDALDE